ncbi:MAG: Gfo/Idh/MocA family oxidoreductase [Proteobacteria bacterium]|nr:Gfo/Idh/MocA family oxidoreductase [Pseudomonadota bacterium]
MIGATAMIAVERVIPAMLEAERSQIIAVASRDPAQARGVAERFGIARVHDTYEALLADPDIEAVYIPLPNHLHLQWTIAAIEARRIHDPSGPGWQARAVRKADGA